MNETLLIYLSTDDIGNTGLALLSFVSLFNGELTFVGYLMWTFLLSFLEKSLMLYNNRISHYLSNSFFLLSACFDRNLLLSFSSSLSPSFSLPPSSAFIVSLSLTFYILFSFVISSMLFLSLSVSPCFFCLFICLFILFILFLEECLPLP